LIRLINFKGATAQDRSLKVRTNLFFDIKDDKTTKTGKRNALQQTTVRVVLRVDPLPRDFVVTLGNAVTPAPHGELDDIVALSALKVDFLEERVADDQCCEVHVGRGEALEIKRVQPFLRVGRYSGVGFDVGSQRDVRYEIGCFFIREERRECGAD